MPRQGQKVATAKGYKVWSTKPRNAYGEDPTRLAPRTINNRTPKEAWNLVMSKGSHNLSDGAFVDLCAKVVNPDLKEGHWIYKYDKKGEMEGRQWVSTGDHTSGGGGGGVRKTTPTEYPSKEKLEEIKRQQKEEEEVIERIGGGPIWKVDGKVFHGVYAEVRTNPLRSNVDYYIYTPSEKHLIPECWWNPMDKAEKKRLEEQEQKAEERKKEKELRSKQSRKQNLLEDFHRRFEYVRDAIDDTQHLNGVKDFTPQLYACATDVITYICDRLETSRDYRRSQMLGLLSVAFRYFDKVNAETYYPSTSRDILDKRSKRLCIATCIIKHIYNSLSEPQVGFRHLWTFNYKTKQYRHYDGHWNYPLWQYDLDALRRIPVHLLERKTTRDIQCLDSEQQRIIHRKLEPFSLGVPLNKILRDAKECIGSDTSLKAGPAPKFLIDEHGLYSVSVGGRVYTLETCPHQALHHMDEETASEISIRQLRKLSTSRLLSIPIPDILDW